MAWFFTQENIAGAEYLITGEDARHIEKSLRMKKGEDVTLVSPDRKEYKCRIDSFCDGGVKVEVLDSAPCVQEASVQVTLYQSLTKGDKMDMIVQKAVELGVHRIVPVITSRCVSRPDEKSLRKKIERWQKISVGAAQQSCRGLVPQVSDAVSFQAALLESVENDLSIIFYEGGGESLSQLVNKDIKSVAIFVGCEGGFDISEVQIAKEKGVIPATLGRRILRAETAPLAGISAIMCLSGNFD
ncbi:MAG: 16S rRNA (uracil(1498)-N(3))-methyltransferase [Ruminococcaceae bacterium]|nr:16S rRNA (uracil(1498)-N(3))-methyltransferase [Oscillospiraceae bacterium]